jgi:hypothetical protein
MLLSALGFATNKDSVPRVVWIVLIGGFLPGVVVSLSIAAETPPGYVDLAFTAIVSTAIVGGTVAWISAKFKRHVLRTTFAAGILFVTLFIATTVAAAAANVAIRLLPHGKWQVAPAAPEELTWLGGPDCHFGIDAVVYARARSGRLYQLSDEFAAGWQITERIPNDASSDFATCQDAPQPGSWLNRGLSPPHDAVSSHRLTLGAGGDCIGEARYVLVRDGTVRRWSRLSCSLGIVILLAMMVIATLVSSLAVVGVLFLKKPPIGWARSMSPAS